MNKDLFKKSNLVPILSSMAVWLLNKLFKNKKMNRGSFWGVIGVVILAAGVVSYFTVNRILNGSTIK